MDEKKKKTDFIDRNQLLGSEETTVDVSISIHL